MAETQDSSDSVEPAVQADPREGMSPKEAYDWEWAALPRWVKAFTLLIGTPAFAILVWSAFDEDAVSGQLQAICFALFAVVALLQIYSLNKIIRDAKRRRG